MKKLLTRREQREYLHGKIGNPVSFKYPRGEEGKVGRLEDRVVVFDSENDEVVYWNMIDLIKFEGHRKQWFRITYYRYKKKQRRWVFAGQTSISDPINIFAKLFIKAIKEKEWIRPLFRKIHRQCSEELA